MPRRVVFCENEPSGSPEASKFRKISFRGVPKLEKSEKQLLGAPRNMKTIKTTHRRPTKYRNCKKMLVVGRRNVKNDKKHPLSADEI